MASKMSQAERISAYRDAPKLASTLRAAIEADSKGDPGKRKLAVETAAAMQALNLGARTAAELMGYDKGSNVAQPYFDVAKGIAEGLIPASEVGKNGIRALADTVRRIRKERKGPDDTPAQDAANAAFKRLRKTVEKHALLYDVRDALTVWIAEKRVLSNVALVARASDAEIQNAIAEVHAAMNAHEAEPAEAEPVASN